ncbi:hypothetical protein [Arthrobacter sp. efr-133-TYG-104]|uniref:hypothetical protein n=1 Tax=Arthrobacter sp. efr-133-TYG-104 TaxID=3040324 RepID=UPI002550C095|nr:hypothetical protein [Arthrobacter sp. efr-133-TYG-104]
MKDFTRGPGESMPGKIVSDWRQLPGRVVQVWHYDQLVDEGSVETVTVDGGVLWLKQTGPIERRMVVKELGIGQQVRVIG